MVCLALRRDICSHTSCTAAKIRCLRLVRNCFFVWIVQAVVQAAWWSFSSSLFAQSLATTRLQHIPTATNLTALSPASLRDAPAAAAFARSCRVSTLVQPTRFGVRELGSASLLAIAPVEQSFVHNAAWIAACSALGNELYSELSVTAVLAAALSERLAFAFGADYARLGIRELLPTHEGFLSLSGYAVLSDWLCGGVTFHNLAFTPLSPLQTSYTRPAQLLVTFGITALETLLFDVGMLLRFNAAALPLHVPHAPSAGISSLVLSARYEPVETLRVRIAVQTIPRELECGVYYELSDAGLQGFSVVAAVSVHETLGITPQFGVVYEW